MKFLMLFMSFFFSLQIVAATSKKILVDLSKNTGDAEFLALGRPSFLKIRGKKGKVSGKMVIKENRFSAKLKVLLDDFDTGLNLRNSHMKENYLETDQFPNATLFISKIPLKKDFINSKSAELNKIPFKGKLKLRGITKVVNGTASLIKKGKKLSGEASFKFILTDFNMKIPSFKGITVAKEVTITAKIDAPFKEVASKAKK